MEDCVRTRRLAAGELAVSPDGGRVAYVLKAPDPVTNQNDYELFVRDLGGTNVRSNGRLLLRSDLLSGIRWLADSQTLAILTQEHDGMSVSLVSAATGTRAIVAGPARKIRSFSISDPGDVIVFSVAVPLAKEPMAEARALRGFPITPGRPPVDWSYSSNQLPDSELFVVDRRRNLDEEATKVSATGLASRPTDRFAGSVDRLEVSPDGRYVAFQFTPEAIPANWSVNSFVKEVEASGFKPSAWGLTEIGTGQTKIAIDAPSAGYMPLTWAKDSKSFLVSTLAPVGSAWEQQDIAAGFGNLLAGWDAYLHLFAVDAKTGDVSEVLSKYTGFGNGRISWKRSDGDLLLPPVNGMIQRMKRVHGKWRQVDGGVLLSLKDRQMHDAVMTHHGLIAIEEDIQTPPNIIVGSGKAGKPVPLTDWNPEYRDIALGKVERVQWTNKYGVPCEGQLIWPIDYREGQRYPLVIMNAPTPHVFVSDATYTTAFPPQSLANAGFFVLMAEYVLRDDLVPKNIPGQLREAYNYMAMIESAVLTLSERHLVESTKVGIIGFSRTSWKVDFMLTHSDFRFAAASSADGGLYTYGSYWIWNREDAGVDSEAMMGGAPYGDTLQNWLKYAPPFNAQRVQTPLLMEYVGYGYLDAPTQAYEFFSALYRQGKSVELYYYPKGSHPLDTPFERVASLERNLDWFRFWMQGYEGKAPDYDPDQYVRWRRLRKSFERSK